MIDGSRNINGVSRATTFLLRSEALLLSDFIQLYCILYRAFEVVKKNGLQTNLGFFGKFC